MKRLRMQKTKIELFYFYLRRCWMIAENHLGIAFALYNYYALTTIMLKDTKFGKPMFVVGLGITFVICVFALGHILIRRQIDRRETSFNNNYNPELMDIHKRSKK